MTVFHLSVFSLESIEKSTAQWDFREVSDVYQILAQGDKLDPSVDDYGVSVNAAVKAIEEADKQAGAEITKFPRTKSLERDGVRRIFKALPNGVIWRMQEQGIRATGVVDHNSVDPTPQSKTASI